MIDRKKGMALSLILILVLSLSMSVFAAFPKVDHSKKGTLSVTMKDINSGKIVPGGTLTIYQVADITLNEDRNDIFVLNDTFKESEVPLDNPESLSVVEELEKYINSKQLAGMKRTIDAKGTVILTDLPVGLYLVCQETPAKGYHKMKSFLISVPMTIDGGYLYEVDATPKVEVSPLPPEKKKPHKEPSEDKPTSAKGERLPQTGQLNWPVPVLGILGICFVGIGMYLRREEKGKYGELS